MMQEEDRLVDYKKLKKIFSNNRQTMEQVMMGLILIAHEKAPELKKSYVGRDWDRLIETSAFIKSAYSHVATKDLNSVISNLEDKVARREVSEEVMKSIDDTIQLSTYIIQDIEYYLSMN